MANDGPIISVRGAVNLAWALTLRRSENEQERELGRMYEAHLREARSGSAETGASDQDRSRRYLDELWLLVGTVTRNLDWHMQNYEEYRRWRDEVTDKSIDYLDDLVSARFVSLRSLLARLLPSALGGTGAFSVFGVALDLETGTASVLAALAAVALGTVMEVVLPIYRAVLVPKQMESSQRDKEEYLLERLRMPCGTELFAFAEQVNDLVKELYGRRFALSRKALESTVAQVVPGGPSRPTAEQIGDMLARLAQHATA